MEEVLSVESGGEQENLQQFGRWIAIGDYTPEDSSHESDVSEYNPSQSPLESHTTAVQTTS